MHVKAAIFDLDDTLFNTHEQLDLQYRGIDTVVPFPDSRDTLAFLKMRGMKLALVSHGNTVIQMQKIAALKVGEYFDAISICAVSEDKEKEFEHIITQFKVPRPEVLIIGDRVEREIEYGNRLGCITVQFCGGKYADVVPQNDFQKPHYCITRLSELKQILADKRPVSL